MSASIIIDGAIAAQAVGVSFGYSRVKESETSIRVNGPAYYNAGNDAPVRLDVEFPERYTYDVFDSYDPETVELDDDQFDTAIDDAIIKAFAAIGYDAWNAHEDDNGTEDRMVRRFEIDQL